MIDDPRLVARRKISRQTVRGSTRKLMGFIVLQVAVLSLASLPALSAEWERLTEPVVSLRVEQLHAPNAMSFLKRTPIRRLRLAGSPVTDKELDFVCDCSELEELDLSSASISDTGLSKLVHLKKLKRLLLENTKNISANGIRVLKCLPQLEDLSLNFTDLGPNVFDAIAQYRNLRRLSLSHTQVTDVGIGNIMKLEHLHSIDISGTRVSDSGAGLLHLLPMLRQLHMLDTSISPKGICKLKKLNELQGSFSIGANEWARVLEGLPDLKILRGFECSDLTDRGVLSLSKLSNLTSLSLAGTRISDAGVKAISSMRLESLNLNGTNATDTGVRTLSSMSTLVSLSLLNTSVTGVAFTTGGFKSLRYLAISRMLSCSGCLAIGKLSVSSLYIPDNTLPTKCIHSILTPRIKQLDLTHNKVDDSLVNRLVELKNLELLDLYGTEISRSGLDRLQRSLPKLRLLAKQKSTQ